MCKKRSKNAQQKVKLKANHNLGKILITDERLIHSCYIKTRIIENTQREKRANNLEQKMYTFFKKVNG